MTLAGVEVLDPNTKVARELYLGNMPSGCNEGMLAEFFSAAMLQAKLNTVSNASSVYAFC
jgi:hypothetical protein